MALFLRSWISKSGHRITLSVISFDKNVIRLQQRELFSSPTASIYSANVYLNKCSQSTGDGTHPSRTPWYDGHLQPTKFYTRIVNAARFKQDSIKLDTNHTRLVSQPKPNIQHEADNAADVTENQNPSTGAPGDKPSADKLNHVFNVLADSLPKLFIKSLDYNMYHPQVILENNIHGKRTVGLYPYIRQVSYLRIIGHFKFAYVKLNILKITQHPEDSTIKVRWTISGISGLKVIFLFWKYKLWNIKQMFEKTIPWYDGFSTFYVDGEGKIYKHVIDKMMPDMDREETVTSRTSPIDAAKLTLIVGMIPRFSDLNSFF